MSYRINKIQALKLVYKDETKLSFDDLLKKDKLVSIHQLNLQVLATQIYKVRNEGLKLLAFIYDCEKQSHNYCQPLVTKYIGDI